MANGLFGGGSGTQLDPYLIEDAHDLNAIRNNMARNVYYKLVNHINLDVSPYNTGEGWEPIGKSGSIFYGNLDGDYFTIRNLYINRPSSTEIGLFGYVGTSSTFNNIIVENSNVTGATFVGTFFGRFSGTELKRCIVKNGQVNGDTGITGGFAGLMNGQISLCSYTGSVKSNGAELGGFAGRFNADASNCYAICTEISSTKTSGNVGGFAGSIYSSVNISQCFAVTDSLIGGKVYGFCYPNTDAYSITFSECYFDSTKQQNTLDTLAIGKKTSEMYGQAIYGNFDKNEFDFYQNSYPSFSFIFTRFTLIYNQNSYKYYSNNKWNTIGEIATENDYKNYGSDISHIPQSAWEQLSGTTEICFYTDNTKKDLLTMIIETEPFSVYDYISETPKVLVYTEDTEDIVVSTTHDKFDMYDVFEDNIEIISYTDDTSVLNANLILEANYSPIDELEGDFEVITWTDEETTERICEFSAIPKPQFLKLENPKQIFGSLKNMFVNNISETYRDEVRVLFCGKDTSQWKVWDKKQGNFILVDASTEQAILKNGMKTDDVIKITESEWQKWKDGFINIGIFLKDNPRDTITSIVETISYADTLPRDTTTIADTSFYILNTTAKIDLTLNGSVLTGVLSDDDLTRVQYRVFLNNNYYYPADGSFTKLGEAPQNIEIAFNSNDIKMGDWNTVKVEFQDFFGTVDYWSAQFMGTYTGLMFKDVYGQYYSNEIGEVLQYLDFGIIIAGQTTVEHEIILKNQYGYDIQNVHLFANTGSLPKGMSIEFSQNQSPFIAQPELKLSGILNNNAELPFFVRLKTELGATPDANGTLDIIVKAEKV